MTRNILDFEAQCVTADCPGCGMVLQQLQYTLEQVRGLLETIATIIARCWYGEHGWAIDQQLRRELRTRVYSNRN